VNTTVEKFLGRKRRFGNYIRSSWLSNSLPLKHASVSLTAFHDGRVHQAKFRDGHLQLNWHVASGFRDQIPHDDVRCVGCLQSWHPFWAICVWNFRSTARACFSKWSDEAQIPGLRNLVINFTETNLDQADILIKFEPFLAFERGFYFVQFSLCLHLLFVPFSYSFSNTVCLKKYLLFIDYFLLKIIFLMSKTYFVCKTTSSRLFYKLALFSWFPSSFWYQMV